MSAGFDDETQACGKLRETLLAAAAVARCSMRDLTVLATQNDPFRVDTPAGHRDGAWLANTAHELGLGTRTIHLRGLHYMVLGRPKPDGTQYTNTDTDWLWLSGTAGKAARWLGYLPFEQIVDHRNAEPIVQIYRETTPDPYLNVGIDVRIPDADELEPYVGVLDFDGVQPYKLVMFGEKSSLADVLAPMAQSYKADLYLPTGEISDTLMHQMASIAAADPRPMIVLCYSDSDPAGWQMPHSIARKLQAFRALGYDFDCKVFQVALMPRQVREYGLPSTPLKDTERRADAWRRETGTEQTEIDALATLQPEVLRDIVRTAVEPFFDSTLDRRVSAASSEWRWRAQAIVNAAMNTERMDMIRGEAASKLATLRTEIDQLNNALRIDVDDFDLPEPIVPLAELDDTAHGKPLLDTSWSFVDQCRALIDSKAYRNLNGNGAGGA